MRIGRLGSGLLASLLAIGGIASAAQAPKLTALGVVTPGQWQLKDGDGATRSLCVADPRLLLQIEHGAVACSRFVIAEDVRSATVHYTCPGAGHGRTTITVDGGQRFRLQTQGMHDGAPFDTDYNARRLGDCTVNDADRAR